MFLYTIIVTYVIGYYVIGYIEHFVNNRFDEYMSEEDKIFHICFSLFWPVTISVIVLYFVLDIIAPYRIRRTVMKLRMPVFIRNVLARIENKLKA